MELIRTSAPKLMVYIPKDLDESEASFTRVGSSKRLVRRERL